MALEHRFKCQVVTAQDGGQAVEVIPRVSPRLVLMDLDLPVDQGLVAARYISEQSNLRPVPVVGISARCDERERHDPAAEKKHNFLLHHLIAATGGCFYGDLVSLTSVLPVFNNRLYADK